MSKSYAQIRQDILNRFPNDDDIREGSPLAITIDPTAAYLADNVFTAIEEFGKECHPLTMSRDHLIKEAELYQMEPYAATPAVGEGKFNIQCQIGDRFTINGIVFQITDRSPTQEEGLFFYYLTCETVGDVGNVSPGKLIPVTLHENLTVSELVRIVINGENVEDTEDFRARYQALFTSKSYGGNIANYFEWLGQVQGVGRAKVLACENPEGVISEKYVTVIITDSNNRKPTDELIKLAQDHIAPKDPPELFGTGNGLAPIGARPEVIGVKEKTIDIEFTVESETTKAVEIKEALEAYIAEQNDTWGNLTVDDNAYRPKERNCVHIRAAQIISAILTVPGVIDVTGLKLNGSEENIDLDWDSIAVLGEINETDRLSAA